MDPFREFDKRFNETRRHIDRVHRWAPVFFLFNAALAVGILGFLGWAIYRVVMHFT